MTARAFLVRGLIAGLLAGIVCFAVAYTVGEQPVDDAIAFEDSAAAHHDEASSHEHEGDDVVVSRQTQSTWGLATATLAYGTAVGGIMALFAAFAMGRVGRLRPQATTGLVVGLGFLSVILLPYLKYPPDPPAVGNPDTIGIRTGDYFAMMVCSVAVVIVATIVASRLVPRLGAYRGLLLTMAGAGVVLIAVSWALPSVDEVPTGFPADVLWRFRVASLTTQVALWATLGIVFVGLIGSLGKTQTQAQSRRELVRT